MSANDFDSHRRQLLRTAIGAAMTAPFASAAFAAEETLRIGLQKSSTLLIILKAKGALDTVLAPLGVKTQWFEFTSGLPTLEALNIGSIDLSADVADTVPLFAQAAGARLAYVAQEAPSPEAQAILVPKDSPIRSVADLKGKKVAVAKAAGSHYLLLKSLENAGLKWKDIEPAYLQPADGRAAFERGAVDAWVVWEPFVAAVQKAKEVRVVADGKYADVGYRRYYLASASYAARRPDVLSQVFAELRKTGQWAKQNPKEAAELLSPLFGLEAATVALSNTRRSLDVRVVDDEAFAEQQNIADAFTAENLLPKKIAVRETVAWAPPRR